MDKILAVLGGVPTSKARNDDTAIDRLFHKFTTAMLIIFAVIVSANQFVGNPITCWVPAHFSGGWEEYTNSYCWIKNTYYLPLESYIPKEGEELQYVITYYQWVPIIFLVLALFFYLPALIWRGLNNKSGVDIKSLIESAESFSSTEKIGSRQTTLAQMTEQMDRYLTAQTQLSSRVTISLKNCVSAMCVCCGRARGTYLVGLYLFTKLVYVLNAILQLFILNYFMNNDFHLYGIRVIQELMAGKDWTASPRFPRVTMCNFNVRRLGSVQRYTVQCVLPVNLFNEKIFLFLWWWIVFISILQLINFVRWLIWCASKKSDLQYIEGCLRSGNINLKESDPDLVTDFTHNYLKADGIFLLRLISGNTNSLTVMDITRALWYNYLARLSTLKA